LIIIHEVTLVAVAEEALKPALAMDLQAVWDGVDSCFPWAPSFGK
jgi:hypothetical protein